MPNENPLPAEQKPDDQKEQIDEKEARRIFDERFDLFMGELSGLCEKHNVPVAIALLVDPMYPATPMVFKTGTSYDQARLLAHTLRAIKEQLLNELKA